MAQKITKAAKKAKIVEMLEKSDAAVCRALVSIYERQTAEEQAASVTVNDNGVGFSGCDAEFGSSLAQKIKKGYTMSPKQIAAGRRLVKKYWAQLIEIADAKNPGWAGEDVDAVVAQEKVAEAKAAEEKAAAVAAEKAKQETLSVALLQVSEKDLGLFEMIAAAEAAVLNAFKVPAEALEVVATKRYARDTQDDQEDEGKFYDDAEAELAAMEGAVGYADEVEESTQEPADSIKPVIRNSLVNLGFQF